MAEINEGPGNNPVLTYEDTREGVVKSEAFDLVILATACAPSSGNPELAKILDIELSPFGFFKTDPSQPMDTTRPGIFTCGCAHSPIDIPESVAQASGGRRTGGPDGDGCRYAQGIMKESASMSDKTEKKQRDTEVQRIGVFICDCGSNIAGHIDCADVTQYASTLPGVVYAKENLYTCSEAGIGEIKNGIKENDLSRVVVASCSPRTHQPLFSSSCGEAGLNPYLFEMANIRDQCSWVHMGDREGGTEKAKDLVRMAVAKAAFLEPQQEIEAELTPRVLVIGGGVAGLSAVETLSDMGLDVALVEKGSELGGFLNRIDRLFSGEKASEFADTLTENVTSKSNVKVYLNAHVETVGGYIGNYEIGIRQEDGEKVTELVGCIVVATGALPLTPEGLYGYDGKRIITQAELEERLRDGSFDAQRVVMIQCVGARCEERAYCSRICCQSAVKNAQFIKRENPDAHVHVLYRDMQMYGTEKEKMLWDARGMGVRFDVYDPEKPPEVKDEEVEFLQVLTGETEKIAYDLVVLSTPLVPREDASELSKLLRVPIDQNNFFMEAHAKLRPLDFAHGRHLSLWIGPLSR